MLANVSAIWQMIGQKNWCPYGRHFVTKAEENQPKKFWNIGTSKVGLILSPLFVKLI
jgi:hypothetical protein